MEGEEDKAGMIEADGMMNGACDDEEDRGFNHVRGECQDNTDLPHNKRNVRYDELQATQCMNYRSKSFFVI